MARHWCISLLLISSYLLVSTRSQSPTCSTPSEPSDSSHYINVFEDMLVTDSDILSRLQVAPFVQGMDVTTPAYEFAGLGSGFAITSMSDSIRRASCAHNEVTFSGRMFIRDSQSDGPLIELSYAGGLESGRVIYLLIVDAAADEIMLGYRHQGDLHSETIAPVRLISGRWRDFTVTLSGNLLTFYFDCVLTVRRVVPLPDYCANDSTVVLNVAGSIQGTSEYTGTTGLYVFAQGLGIHFGPGGLQRQCPSISEECPSCGQFNNLLQKLAMAQDRMVSLNERIKELEENTSRCIQEETPSPPSSIDCPVQDGLQPRVIPNGQFLLTHNNTRICYCDNGHDVCTILSDVNLSTPAPPSCPGANTSTGQQEDPTAEPQPSGPACHSPVELNNIPVPVGETVPLSLGNSMCRLYTCKDEGKFGLNLEDEDFDCRTLSDECTSLSEVDIILYRCCGLCDECSFTTCRNNSFCMVEDNPSSTATCVCNSGFVKMGDSEDCVDRNECMLGMRPGGHNCPMESSDCINTEGSFYCVCRPGYQLNNNTSFCEDIDECARDGICGEAGICANKPGTYSCSCMSGYVEDQDGFCQPVCEPACMNGGVCLSPGNCSCTPEFSGDRCQHDVNECLDPDLNTCREALPCRPGQNCSSTVECVNTVGGHFCRCKRGFQEVSGSCKDVDECKLRIHNCVGGASCINTFGGFRCICSEKNDSGVVTTNNCTGRCVRNKLFYADGTNFFDGCLNCTCLGGEVTCRRLTCNCSNPTHMNDTKCCSECSRRDCILSDNSIRIRPGATYINVSNRCQRINCLQNLTTVVVDHSKKCPTLDCPMAMQTTPMGKCCPICMRPRCDSSMEGRTMSFRNGCEQCICQNSQWSCSKRMECPPVNCRGEDIAFYRNGCCPVCKQQVLGMMDTLCPT